MSGAVADGYIGGVISKLDSGTVENCSFSGNLGNTGYYCGGVVGEMTGGAIKNCSFSGTIKEEIYNYVDGIVAHMTGGSIEDCTSKATIEEDINWQTTYCGGIVGHAQIATFSAIVQPIKYC